MIARIALLLALLGGLVLANRALDRSRAETREQAVRVRRLVTEQQFRDRPIALVRLGTGDGRTFLYQRAAGLWRCMSWRGAPALGARIESLVGSLLDAQGVVLSERPARPSDFGFDLPSMRTLWLQGPKADAADPLSDLILGCDFGAALGGREGCYVRPHGQSAIWSVDVDPGADLGRDDTGARPPLVDTKLVSEAWPGGSPRIRTIRVSRPGQPDFELELRKLELDSAALMAGTPPFEWVLHRFGAEETPTQIVAVAYTSYLLNTEWRDIVDPALAGRLGARSPTAAVTIFPGAAGNPLSLQLLPGTSPAGRPVVLNTHAQLLYEIEPDQVPLLFPVDGQFAADVGVNPWENLVGQGR